MLWSVPLPLAWLSLAPRLFSSLARAALVFVSILLPLSSAAALALSLPPMPVSVPQLSFAILLFAAPLPCVVIQHVFQALPLPFCASSKAQILWRSHDCYRNYRNYLDSKEPSFDLFHWKRINFAISRGRCWSLALRDQGGWSMLNHWYFSFILLSLLS